MPLGVEWVGLVGLLPEECDDGPVGPCARSRSVPQPRKQASGAAQAKRTSVRGGDFPGSLE